MTIRRNGRPDPKRIQTVERQYWMKADGSGRAAEKGEKGAIPCR